ncbi:MAG: aminotransferase class IV [Saprospiraceae bacterium]|nr:aminotransferase class IV [Saprospiraceae bacterium]
MCQLLESIKYVDGIPQNLSNHQARVNQSILVHFPERNLLDLDLILPVKKNLPGIYKCRLIYDENSEKISLATYHIRPIKSLKIVDGPHLNYSHKYVDRRVIDQLFECRQEHNDIIILKNGCVTDSSYANLAFYSSGIWYTPLHPILPGTKRQKLIDAGIIETVEIKLSDIKQFETVSLINAMLDLGEVEIPISQIY